MATYSGGFDNSGYTLYLDVTESNVSIANNTSVINWTLRIVSTKALTYGSWDWDGTPYSVKIDGVQVASGSKSYDFRNYQNLTVASGSKTITHNTDGSRSVSCSATFGNSSTPIGDATASGTFALSKIPRYATSNQSLKSKTETSITMNWSSDSTIDYVWYSTDWGTTWKEVGSVNATSGSYTINTQSKDTSSITANTTYNVITRVRRKDSQLTTNSDKLSVTTYDYPHITKVETIDLVIGNSQTLTLYNPLSRSVTVRMYKDSTSGTQLYSGTTNSTSIKFTPTASTLYASIPSSQSGNCVYSVIYSSSTKTTTGSYTYKIKGTETPTVGTITYADTNATVTAITGNNQHIVQNKSNLKVTFTSATPKNSASISKHTFVLNGVTKTSTSSSGTVDFGTVNSANNLTLTITVTDSRGLSTSTTKTITMLAHSNPNAIVTLERLNNYEDESYLTVDGSISSVNSKNAMTIKYRYKVSGGSYNSFKTISDNTKQTLSLDKNNMYIFNIVVTDSFGATYDKEHTLGKGVFPLFIDVEKNSVGINALPKGNGILEVGGYILENKREFSIPLTSGENYGWYLAFSGTLTGYMNKGFMVAIQQTYNGGAGIFYINLRCNNGATLTIQRFHWLTYTSISSSSVSLVVDGNDFYVYLKTTTNHQQFYLRILQEKQLNGGNYGLFTINTPALADTVDEPNGVNPTDLKELLGLS